MADNGLILYGVGDVGPIHEPMNIYGHFVRDTLKAGDIRIGQCERLYSKRGALQLHSGVHERPLAESFAEVYTDCGFNVISLAGNHAMDWGPDALMDTVDMFKRLGIPTCGAGANIEEARKPVILEKKGVKVAVLAYCSVVLDGYAATAKTPGLAPLRAHTYYEPMEYQAGMPPRVVTVPNKADLDAMVADVKAAKKAADVVVLSMHWGLHFIPRIIADYQPIMADAAFAAGADLILGHHAHLPKGIEMRQGKAVFYSLGNFIMTSNLTKRLMSKEGTGDAELARKRFARRYNTEVHPDDPLPYGTDSKRSLIAKAVIGKQGVQKVSFLPALIDKQCRPELLKNGDPRFDDAVRYMSWASDEMTQKFTVAGDEVIVTPK